MVTYKKLTYNTNKIQVESAIRDGNGANISDNYLKSEDAASQFQEKLVSGTNVKTINGTSILGSGNIAVSGEVTVDTALSTTSTNPVQNKVINIALNNKQATLVSGTNIKTINGTSILGSGDIAISGEVTVDTALSPTSTNPVQNKVINTALNDKQDSLVSGTNIKTINGTSILGSGDIAISGEVTVDTALSPTSTNPVQNKVINTALNDKQDSLVSGTNIKTINGNSLLGSGNIDISGGSYTAGTGISISNNVISTLVRPTTVTFENSSIVILTSSNINLPYFYIPNINNFEIIADTTGLIKSTSSYLSGALYAYLPVNSSVDIQYNNALQYSQDSNYHLYVKSSNSAYNKITLGTEDISSRGAFTNINATINLNSTYFNFSTLKNCDLFVGVYILGYSSSDSSNKYVYSSSYNVTGTIQGNVLDFVIDKIFTTITTYVYKDAMIVVYSISNIRDA